MWHDSMRSTECWLPLLILKPCYIYCFTFLLFTLSVDPIQVQQQQIQTVVFTIPIFEPLPSQYYVRVISDRWLGSEMTFPISFQHLILPEKHPPHTGMVNSMMLISVILFKYSNMVSSRLVLIALSARKFICKIKTQDVKICNRYVKQLWMMKHLSEIGLGFVNRLFTFGSDLNLSTTTI